MEEYNDEGLNPWFYVKYNKCGIDDYSTRIGGAPSYTFNKETIDWPFYKTVQGDLVPMKFLAQIEKEHNSYIYLFLGIADESVGEDFYDYINGQSAAFVEVNNWWSPWIVVQKIASIPEEYLWSPLEAVKPVNNIPEKPFWAQENWGEENSSSYKQFLFQISEAPGGIEQINIDMETYIFANDNQEVVLFNQSY